MATAVCAPACTAELMRIGRSYHQPPSAIMLVLRDKSDSYTRYVDSYTHHALHAHSAQCAHLIVASIHQAMCVRAHLCDCTYVCVCGYFACVCVCVRQNQNGGR